MNLENPIHFDTTEGINTEQFSGPILMKPNRKSYMVRYFLMVLAVLLSLAFLITALAIKPSKLELKIGFFLGAFVAFGVFWLLKRINTKDNKKIKIGEFDQDKIILYNENEKGKFTNEDVDIYLWDDILSAKINIVFFQETFVGPLTIETNEVIVTIKDVMVLPNMYDLQERTDKFKVIHPAEEMHAERQEQVLEEVEDEENDSVVDFNKKFEGIIENDEAEQVIINHDKNDEIITREAEDSKK